MTKGPTLEISKEIHSMKYRLVGEPFEDCCYRLSSTLSDNDEHRQALNDIFLDMRFMPAGRVQAAIGAPKRVTPWNCFVSGTISDDFNDIMEKAKEAGHTMRLGGGIGYDFSTLRPRGSLIKSLGSSSSGPISFMDIFDSVCGTISSAGHRRGAQMGVLRVDHPDIEEFVSAKRNTTKLTRFNISVGITDAFMNAVKNKEQFNLKFHNKIYKTVEAETLWDQIMRSTWHWAEPGVLFIDRINEENNLWYCEDIAATNPCLHPETLIETVNGPVKIKDIVEPTIVYTMTEDGKLSSSKSSASWVSKKNAKTLKITVGSGRELICTPEHKIFVRNKGWIEAKNLVKGDKLVHLCRSRRGAKYAGIKLSTEPNRAYQMEHRFVVEAAGTSLQLGEDVHHINGDTFNNTCSNLEVMPHSNHSKHTALNDNPQVHQVHDSNGKFLATGISKKDIQGVPRHLASNLKNQNSTCIISIENGPVTDVYDLTVKGTHNMIANQLVIHNCGEQPLPPYGACLLGSFNLVKYIKDNDFDFTKFEEDIRNIVRAMDNIMDIGVYPLPQQETEGKAKRRMGLGVTGLANALERLGLPYGSAEFISYMASILGELRNIAYDTSADLAKEKGHFPAYNKKYLKGKFIQNLPTEIQEKIKKYGIRNSHLTSIAPTGTISLAADNISSGIEPVFTHSYTRTIITEDGVRHEDVEDFGYRVWGLKGRTASELSPEEHVSVLIEAQKYVDSACSKTCNVGADVSWERFKNIYMMAFDGGCKGVTTFRSAGKRMGILNEKKIEKEYISDEDEVQVCTIDGTTGQPTCS